MLRQKYILESVQNYFAQSFDCHEGYTDIDPVFDRYFGKSTCNSGTLSYIPYYDPSCNAPATDRLNIYDLEGIKCDYLPWIEGEKVWVSCKFGEIQNNEKEETVDDEEEIDDGWDDGGDDDWEKEEPEPKEEDDQQPTTPD